MELSDPYILNGQHYSENELLSFLSESISSGNLEQWQSEIYSFILNFFNEQITLLQKTSGTTGDPKTIVLSREAMIHSAKMTLDYFHLEPGNTALLCLPIHYIAGKMMIIRALVGGLDLIIAEPSGNPMKNIDQAIHFGAMVTLQVYESTMHPGKLDLIEKLIVGGGELSPDLLTEINKLSYTSVYESFAMSETYTHFAIRQINGDSPAPIFKCLNGVEIEQDERACLIVDIPGITQGKIISNDLVEIYSKDEFKWLGRIDNVINTGGIKIIPEILEKKISENLGLSLLLIGIPDRRLGQKLIMIVEGDEEALRQDQIIEKLKTILKRNEIPKEIRIIKKFPRNKSMKVDRRVLMKMVSN